TIINSKMRWTIIIVAIFALVAMVISNDVYNDNMEEMNPMGSNMYPGGVNVVDNNAYVPRSKRWNHWEEERRRREEEERRRHRGW
ncbi:unnamed protein product, partial [Adineta steineri]